MNKLSFSYQKFEYKLRSSKNLLLFVFFCAAIQNIAICQQVAILKYNGGGDWYANPTAVPNLIAFCNKNINTNISEPETVEVGSIDIFNFPIIFMTGHGNVIFSEIEAENLRNYLISGGFLHISDNYGMDLYIRDALKKVFPSTELQAIPYNHPIFHQTFNFENGVPKIHEHNNKKPMGYGIFYENRLVCFYDYEADLSDGWEDEEIHNNPLELREKALKMGANIVEFAFKN